MAQRPSAAAGIPEWLSPIVSSIPAQLFGYHLTRHRVEYETPRTIHKVTETINHQVFRRLVERFIYDPLYENFPINQRAFTQHGYGWICRNL